MIRIIRFTLLLPALFIVFGTGILLGIFRPFNPNNVYIVSKTLSLLGRYLMGLEFVVRGEEHLPKEGSTIFISNHQNNFDIFPGGHLCPPRTVTLGKIEILFIPVFNLFYWLGGNVLINRKNQKKAFESMNRVREKLDQENTSIWIMPEGHRNWGKGLLPFKKGAFHTAAQCNASITPVCFSTYHGRMDWGKWRSGRILAQILPPRKASGQSSEAIVELRDSCYLQMKDTIEALDKELE